MRIDIATLFPDMCEAFLNESIIGKGRRKGYVDLWTHNIRDYTVSKQRRVDDYPYGGGCGMLMQAQPIADCVAEINRRQQAYFCRMRALKAAADAAGVAPVTADETALSAQKEGSSGNGVLPLTPGSQPLEPFVGEYKPHTVFLTATGVPYTQEKAKQLAKLPCLTLVCGHYEGIDQRVIDALADEEISIGDYVITGGELGALVVADSVARLQPGVLSEPEGYEGESYYSGLLEYPQYTRPETWEGRSVPDVLLSGHHANIVAWQKEQSEQRTRERRPDLWQKYQEKQTK